MLSNIKIKHKLALLVTIFIIGFGIFGALAYKTISDTKFDGETFHQISLRTDLVADILPPPEYIIETHLTTYQLLNEESKSKIESLIQYETSLKDDYLSRHDVWVNDLAEGDLKTAMISETYKPAIEYYNVLENEFIPAVRNGDKVKAKDILDNKLTKLYDAHREKINKVVKLANNEALTIKNAAKDTYNSDIINLICLAIGILIFTIIFCIILIRTITKPISVVTKHLKTFSTGDFSNQIPQKYIELKDELGDISRATNKMQESIKEIINTIINETENINSSIISSNNNFASLSADLQDAAATVEQLSAEIQETASSTLEIDSASSNIETAIKVISDTAQEGAISADQISTKANSLKENAMTSQNYANDLRLNIDKSVIEAIDKSKEVEKIQALSDAILQISTQTNLLALNAAIESARAGESGRGFSVVSEEIRQLAESSQSTVNEMQNTIKLVFEAVNSLVNTSKETLSFIDNEVVSGYNELVKTGENYGQDSVFINNLVSELSATSEELLSSIKTVSEAISSISNTSSESAAGINQITEKISNITNQARDVQNQSEHIMLSANKLKEHVSSFTI
jgi:methyl-accepting chemotaxis protein